MIILKNYILIIHNTDDYNPKRIETTPRGLHCACQKTLRKTSGSQALSLVRNHIRSRLRYSLRRSTQMVPLRGVRNKYMHTLTLSPSTWFFRRMDMKFLKNFLEQHQMKKDQIDSIMRFIYSTKRKDKSFKQPDGWRLVWRTVFIHAVTVIKMTCSIIHK